MLFGTATPGALVQLMLDSVQIGSATADAEGLWQALANVIGEASVSLIARTSLGETLDSAPYRLAVDQTAPAAPVLLGFAGDTTGDRSQPIWQTVDTTPSVAGRAEPGAIIRAFDGATLLGTDRADAGGAWTLDLGTRRLGQYYAIGIEAEDGAGNASTRAPLHLRVGETTIPEVTAVEGPAAANYQAGAALDFTLQCNKPVSITTPQGGAGPLLEVLVGDQVLTAGYVASPAPHRLTFRLLIPAGAVDQDGIALGQLLANGATIADSSNNRLAGGLAGLPDLSGVLVQADLAAPVVAGILGPPAGNHPAGDTLVFTLAFDERVLLLDAGDGGPRLEVLFGGTTWLAAYQGQPAPDRLAFSLVVQAEAVAQTGIALGRLLPGGARITDLAGNAWAGELGPLPDLSAVLLQADLTPPAVAAIMPGGTGPVGFGGMVIIQLHMTEAVQVAAGLGAPTLSLAIAGQEVRASLLPAEPGDGPEVLRFGAAVPAGLETVGVAVLGLSDPAGAITDLVGHPLRLGLPAASGLARLVIDTLPPEASLIAPPDGRYSPGQHLQFILATAEPVHLAEGLELPGLLLDLGGSMREAGFDAAHSTPTRLAFTLQVQDGDVARGGIRVAGLADPAGRLQDVAGNALHFDPPLGRLAASLWPEDQTPPQLLAAEGPAPGGPRDILLHFSEPVLLAGTAPSLTVMVDGTPYVAALAGAPVAAALAFHLDLPVGAPAPGRIALGALALGGGPIQDAAGNDWDGAGLAGRAWHYARPDHAPLTGGSGDDIFFVASQADALFETPDEGTDTVIATASFYLYPNIENPDPGRTAPAASSASATPSPTASPAMRATTC